MALIIGLDGVGQPTPVNRIASLERMLQGYPPIPHPREWTSPSPTAYFQGKGKEVRDGTREERLTRGVAIIKTVSIALIITRVTIINL